MWVRQLHRSACANLPRVALLLMLAVAVALPPACSGPPPRPTLVDSPAINWENIISDLDCSQVNRGIEVLGVQFSDIRIRGVRDAFVWVDCYHDTSPWPHQLEVFDGSSEPASPQRMAVLINAQEGELVRGVSFSDTAVLVDIARYSESDGLCCPSMKERRTFTWDGARYTEAKA
jgi:hypothetical protein